MDFLPGDKLFAPLIDDKSFWIMALITHHILVLILSEVSYDVENRVHDTFSGVLFILFNRTLREATLSRLDTEIS